jgi:hypothetical protein
MDHIAAQGRRTNSVFLAGDKMIVREGVRAVSGKPRLGVVGLTPATRLSPVA